MEINFAILIRFLSQLCVIFRDVFNSLRRRPLKIWDVLFGTNTDHLSFGHLENLHCRTLPKFYFWKIKLMP